MFFYLLDSLIIIYIILGLFRSQLVSFFLFFFTGSTSVDHFNIFVTARPPYHKFLCSKLKVVGAP